MNKVESKTGKTDQFKGVNNLNMSAINQPNIKDKLNKNAVRPVLQTRGSNLNHIDKDNLDHLFLKKKPMFKGFDIGQDKNVTLDKKSLDNKENLNEHSNKNDRFTIDDLNTDAFNEFQKKSLKREYHKKGNKDSDQNEFNERLIEATLGINSSSKKNPLFSEDNYNKQFEINLDVDDQEDDSLNINLKPNNNGLNDLNKQYDNKWNKSSDSRTNQSFCETFGKSDNNLNFNENNLIHDSTNKISTKPKLLSSVKKFYNKNNNDKNKNQHNS
mmetsp:Transcript_52841/g.115430  ORF Transcript_52841/g.115430 Transcript_52841/m.115430 type:complete len:271 (+) Transcript_52841:130-942(+)